ncbi:MAG: sugar ABC transporter permease [Hyphomicrobiales bacterium]|nr:sugar ABC transporter permease [Hyphomicrobiales bacterium]MDE2113337.1 sugar ABC transporter permease [Hyphomicrobiales bacterium]
MSLAEPVMAGIQRLIGAKRMPWVFLAPNLVFFATFVFVPLLIDFGYSLTGGTHLFLSQRPWDGSAQYGHLFNCQNFSNPNSCEQDRFWHAIFNTGTFVVFQVSAMVLASLITALALNKRIRARGFFRAVFFFPVLLSPVVVALIWKWILQRDGLLNAWLTAFGGSKVLFFISPHWAMFWAIFVSVWAHMGFYTLILLAGLQAIPGDLYEAAQMDATSATRVLWRITLPLLMPNLIVVVVLALIKSVQTFDEVYVLTGGGPGTATLMIVQYIYETGFANQVQNFGLAAAASVVLGVALFFLTLLQLALSRRKGEAL